MIQSAPYVSFYAFFRISDRLTGIRVSRATELKGLDTPEVGSLAYPDFQPAEIIEA